MFTTQELLDIIAATRITADRYETLATAPDTLNTLRTNYIVLAQDMRALNHKAREIARSERP